MAQRRPFIFDNANGRVITFDPGDLDSGESLLGSDRLNALIAHLEAAGASGLLRRFALHAAERSAARFPDTGADLRAQARAALDDPDPEVLQQIRDAHHGTAMAAGAVGLPHRASNAATFLASFAACHPDAASAAREAARMAHLWAELCDTAPAPDEITQQLLDWLLDHLSNTSESA